MHIQNIGAGVYSELAYTTSATTTEPADQAAWVALTYTDIEKINTFPSVGNPANITNTPQFGQAISAQINGQADAPSQEFTLNWTGLDHVALQDLAGDNVQRAWRVRIANATLPDTLLAGTEHDDFYFLGSVASLVITPGLQGNTATLTVASSTEQSGPFTTA